MTEASLSRSRLVETPGDRPPDGIQAFWVKRDDGAVLRAAVVPAKGEARGSVILSPGRTEPIEKYFEVLGELQDRGFSVLIHDWRGQGLSTRPLDDPLLGHARGWRPYLADFRRLLEVFGDRLPEPRLALGHSMGGGLTALALAEGAASFAGAVLSAPMLGLNTEPNRPSAAQAMSFAMNFIGRAKRLVLAPADPLQERFEDNRLTHDRRRWERSRAHLLAEPELRLGGITWGWLAFAFTLSARVEASRRWGRLSIPVAIVAAGEEAIVDNAASRRLAMRMPLGRYIEVEGAYHEILMETEERRAVFWKVFDEVADAAAPKATAGLASEASSRRPRRPAAKASLAGGS